MARCAARCGTCPPCVTSAKDVERVRLWREKNGRPKAEQNDGSRARSARWKARNPETVRASKRRSEGRRRARKYGSSWEPVDPEIVWVRDEGLCYLCGLPADPTDWHLDHVQPLAHGGDHTYLNTAVTHPACNREKGATPWPTVTVIS